MRKLYNNNSHPTLKDIENQMILNQSLKSQSQQNIHQINYQLNTVAK